MQDQELRGFCKAALVREVLQTPPGCSSAEKKWLEIFKIGQLNLHTEVDVPDTMGAELGLGWMSDFGCILDSDSPWWRLVQLQKSDRADSHTNEEIMSSLRGNARISAERNERQPIHVIGSLVVVKVIWWCKAGLILSKVVWNDDDTSQDDQTRRSLTGVSTNRGERLINQCV